MRRRVVLGGLVLVLAATGLVLAGGGAAKSEQEPFKVAFIYPGPHNDQGWSQAHDAGRLAIEKALGSQVQTTYKENVFSNAQVPQIVAGLVREGYQMIFGCSFGMFENGVNGQLYNKYPEVIFEQATGLQIKKNQAEYFGAGEDTIYLSGMAAGAASKKGLIGYVVPFGIPEVVRHINAFALGAQATHPGARVKLIWTNAWFSPQKETAAAKALIASGVDVLGQNVDSPSAGVVAESKGIPWVGYDSNARNVGAEAVADGGDLQLGAVLRQARQGGDRRHVEAGLLLRHDQGRLHGPRSVRPEGLARRRRRRSPRSEGDRRREVPRLPGAAVRPEREAQGRRRASSSSSQGPVHDAVARQGRGRQGLLGPAARASRWGTPPPPPLRDERGAGSSGASRAPAVRMRGITKRFPGVLANDDVTSRRRRRGARAPR